MNVVYAMKYLMRVSNVQDVHFYVVQGVLIIIILLIIIIVLFVDIKKSTVLYIYMIKYHPYKSVSTYKGKFI